MREREKRYIFGDSVGYSFFRFMLVIALGHNNFTKEELYFILESLNQKNLFLSATHISNLKIFKGFG